MNSTTSRHDWAVADIHALFDLPLVELVHQAQTAHRQHFDPTQIQASALLSIKTGGCAEDCGYCSQSARYETGLAREALMATPAVVAAAQVAQAAGATRFCLGAAWRAPKPRDMAALCERVTAVKALGLEVCLTAGMLTQAQAEQLQAAGLDYYNHNLDTSPEYYPEVITTRTYQDRLDTLDYVRAAGLSVCCGGIIGLGESRHDRARLLQVLANMAQHPESVPINLLVPVPGTPLAETPLLDPLELVRTIAVARLLMPTSYVRLSAGRTGLSPAEQALCFMAGANSLFWGEQLLTTPNPGEHSDRALLAQLGMRLESGAV